MGIFTVQTVTVLLYILGFAWCTPENATLSGGQMTGIVTPPGNNSSLHPEKRIIGGEEADENEFPHQVFVFTEVETNGRTSYEVCGGSLVARNYVLTAAHCVTKMNLKNTRVWAGIHEVNLEFPDFSRQESRASKIFIHKCFNPKWLETGDLRNDIALIKLRRPLDFNFRRVKSIKIDVRDRVRVGRSVTVVGWGRTRDFDERSLSGVLKKAQLDIISESQCLRALPTPFIRYDSQICALSGSGSACSGDSGGPLICSENENYVCGITSFVPAIGCSSGPSGYTRVSHFKNWIYDVVKNGRQSSMDCVGEGRGSLVTSNGFSYGVVVLISFQYLL